jgi:LytTr DNA-binding domain-containing protein
MIWIVFHDIFAECATNFMSDVNNEQQRARVEPVLDRNTPASDQARTVTASAGVAGMSGTDWLLYGSVPVITLAIGIVNALSIAQDISRHGGVYEIRTPLLWEMSSVIMIILSAPLLFVAIWRMRRASGWLPRAGLAIAAMFAFSTLHIAGMVGLRKLLMFLIGGSYDFHLSLGTLVYEFRKDVITCLLIGGALWLIDTRREAQQLRHTQSSARQDLPSAKPHIVWLRDGSSRIRIDPAEILLISSAGNYVEYSLASGISHLVRGTLAGEEARLKDYNLVRVHRTRLINLSRVTGFQGGPNGDFELTLDTGQTVSGSRRYRQAVASIEALDQQPTVSNNNVS